MMKKMKSGLTALLLVMMVLSLTACAGRGQDTGNGGTENGNTGTTPATSAMQQTVPVETSVNDNNRAEESTGVINGVLDDVENGINDIRNSDEGTNEETRDTVNETTRAGGTGSGTMTTGAAGE